MGATTVPTGERLRQRHVRRLGWITILAFGFNALGWIGVRLWPEAATNGVWSVVSLLAAFLIGALIGRSWALLMTLAFGVIHAIPVYLRLLPGYLSTWEDALWWAFALTLLLTLTGLGVMTRHAIRWVQSQGVH